MLELCPKCKGTRQFSSLGHMSAPCEHCQSKGYIEQEEQTRAALTGGDDVPYDFQFVNEPEKSVKKVKQKHINS